MAMNYLLKLIFWDSRGITPGGVTVAKAE